MAAFLLTRSTSRPLRRLGVAVAVAAGLVALIAGGLRVGGSLGHGRSGGPPCRASDGTSRFALDEEQARNATTIAAVGKRMGLADHAVTIALAAALQESKLHNLSHGDRDSVGLFQQRPSQGWGTRAQIMVPAYAAGAFYERLAQVPGWETAAVTEAAQAVQISAAPNAYAQWEASARIVAQALTGEVAAGLSCRVSVKAGALNAASLASAASRELGSPGIGPVSSEARGWTAAAWLVGHARSLGVASVSFNGQRWDGASGVWKAHPPVIRSVTINQP